MRKVLVDRELLERIASDDEGVASSADFEDLKLVLAQPAEAEGAEIVAYATPDEYGGWQMLFFDEKEAMLYVEENEQPSALVLHSALSAVTAERDRLRALIAECAEYLNTDRETTIGSGSILHRQMIAAMAAKEV